MRSSITPRDTHTYIKKSKSRIIILRFRVAHQPFFHKVSSQHPLQESNWKGKCNPFIFQSNRPSMCRAPSLTFSPIFLVHSCVAFISSFLFHDYIHKLRFHGLTTPYHVSPSSPPVKITIGALALNHLEAVKELTVIRTNQGSVSMGPPLLDCSLRNPTFHSLKTAVKTSPTAAHSIPFKVDTNTCLLRILVHTPKIEVLIRIPGRYMAMYANNAPNTGLKPVATAARNKTKFYNQ